MVYIVSDLSAHQEKLPLAMSIVLNHNVPENSFHWTNIIRQQLLFKWLHSIPLRQYTYINLTNYRIFTSADRYVIFLITNNISRNISGTNYLYISSVISLRKSIFWNTKSFCAFSYFFKTDRVMEYCKSYLAYLNRAMFHN